MADPKRVTRHKYATFIHHLHNESLYDALEIVNMAEHLNLFERAGFDRSQGAVMRAIDTLYRTSKRKLPAEPDDYLEDPVGVFRHAYYGWRWKMLLPIHQYSAAEWNEMLALHKDFLESRNPELANLEVSDIKQPEIHSSSQSMVQTHPGGNNVPLYFDCPPLNEQRHFSEPGTRVAKAQEPDQKDPQEQGPAEEPAQAAVQKTAESEVAAEKATSEATQDKEVKTEAASKPANEPEANKEHAEEAKQEQEERKPGQGEEEKREQKEKKELEEKSKQAPRHTSTRSKPRMPRFVRFLLVAFVLSLIFFNTQVIQIFNIPFIDQYFKNRSLDDSTLQKSQKTLAWAEYQKAEFALDNRHYMLAEKHCLKSIKEFGNDKSRALPQFLMINLLIMTKRFEEADICIEEERQFCEALHWLDGLRSCTVKRIQRLVVSQKFHEARPEIEQFFNEYNQAQFSTNHTCHVDKAYIYYLLAHMSYIEKDYKDFAKNSILSLSHYRLAGFGHRVAIANSYAGFSQYLNGNLTQARKYLRAADLTLREMGNSEFHLIQNQIFTAFLPETLEEEREQALKRAEAFLMFHPDEELARFCDHLRTLDPK